MSEHGYNRYTSGCRCDTCKAAKAAYMSRKRKQATANALNGVMVDGVRHGTRVAYKDHGCRCDICVYVMRSIHRRWCRERRARAGDAA